MKKFTAAFYGQDLEIWHFHLKKYELSCIKGKIHENFPCQIDAAGQGKKISCLRVLQISLPYSTTGNFSVYIHTSHVLPIGTGNYWNSKPNMTDGLAWHFYSLCTPLNLVKKRPK